MRPRKSKSQDGNPCEAIRGVWEGAYVAQFLRLFQGKFGFTSVSTQELEEAIGDPLSLVVPDICARLLRLLVSSDDIRITNFEETLWQHLPDDIKTGGPDWSWLQAAPVDKLSILKWLVDYVFEEKEEELVDFLDDHFDAEDLRGLCCGQDALNNFYWYLNDLRLYRENTLKKNKKEWECVCLTLSDWCLFLKQFRKTANFQERELYNYLVNQLLPLIEGQLREEANRVEKRIQLDNSVLLQKERRDLGIMLEKLPPSLDCNGGLVNGGSGTPESKLHDASRTSNPNSVGSNSGGGGDIKHEFPEDVKPHCGAPPLEDIKPNVLELCPPVSSPCSRPPQTPELCSSVPSQPLMCQMTPPQSNRSMLAADGTGGVLCDPPSNEGSVCSNKENAPPSAANVSQPSPHMVPVTHIPPTSAPSSLPPELPPVTAMTNMVPPPAAAGIKPPPAQSTSEAQYMQQQSQIFVFCTALANKAAESVLTGQFSSIIGFHCVQPGTKRILEKHPLKVQQFNRQNPAAWLNSLAQMKQQQQGGSAAARAMKGGHPPPMMGGQYHPPPQVPGPCVGPCHAHHCQPWPGPKESWDMPQQQHFGGARLSHPCRGGPPHPMVTPPTPGGFPHSHGGPQFDMMNHGQPPQLATGVKIPNENLTPQQLQHREDRLAALRKMKQMLFREQGGEPQPVQDGMFQGFSPQHPPLDWQPQQQQQPSPQHQQQSLQQQQQSLQQQQQSLQQQQQFFEPVGRKPTPPSMPSPLAASTPRPPPPYHTTTPRSTSLPPSPSMSPAMPHIRPPQGSTPVNSPKSTPTSTPTPFLPSPSSSRGKQPLTPASLPPSTPPSDMNSNTGDSALFGFCQQQQQQKLPGQQGEPSLMPVPSPQHIQYLNTFDGQELTIQKQPNTSLDSDNNGSLNSSLENAPPVSSPFHPESQQHQGPGHFVGGERFPGMMEQGAPRFPSPGAYGSPMEARFNPRMPSCDMRFRHPAMESPQFQGSGIKSEPMRFPAMEGAHFNMQDPYGAARGFEPAAPSGGESTHLHNLQKMAPPFDYNPPTSRMGPAEASPHHDPTLDLPPHNPAGQRLTHFDPIASMAAMTGSGGDIVPPPGPPTDRNMNMASMHMAGSRSNMVNFNSTLQGVNGGFNPMGASGGPSPQTVNNTYVNATMSIHNLNIQNMAPNAGYGLQPVQNAVQTTTAVSHSVMHTASSPKPPRAAYMARPPRTPYNSIQVKVTAPNTIQYLPAPRGGPPQAAGPRPPEFMQRFNTLSNLEAKVPTQTLSYYPNARQRFQGYPPAPAGYPPPSKVMGLDPTASQPLPPTVGGGGPAAGHYKPFYGPTTADPNYAVQFHNFQQQLYATNTRSQMNSSFFGNPK